MGLVWANFGLRRPKNGQNKNLKIVDFLMLLVSVHAMCLHRKFKYEIGIPSLMTSWWLHDDFMMASWWLHDDSNDFLMTLWWLCNNYLMARLVKIGKQITEKRYLMQFAVRIAEFSNGVYRIKEDFCLRINILKENDWLLGFGLMTNCQKVSKFEFQSQFSTSKVIQKFINLFFHERIGTTV